MTFVNDFSPFAIHFRIAGHDVGLRWYGLAYFLGFALASWSFRWAIRRGLLPGATEKTLERTVLAVILGVLLGGRMGYVLQNLSSWSRDPLFPIRIWEGGMAFFGGLVGVILGLARVARKERVSFWALNDVATLPAMLGLGFGRIANFINAELWGRPTGGNWGVIYPRVDQTPRHPSELYESASHFLAFALLLWISRRYHGWRVDHPGAMSAIFLMLYGAFRFATDFYREEPLIGPLNTGQYASLVIFGIGLVLYVWRAHAKVSVPDIQASN